MRIIYHLYVSGLYKHINFIQFNQDSAVFQIVLLLTRPVKAPEIIQVSDYSDLKKWRSTVVKYC